MAGIGKPVGVEAGVGQADGEVVAAVAVEVSGRHGVSAGEPRPDGEGADVGGTGVLAVDEGGLLLDDGQFGLAVTVEVARCEVPAAGDVRAGHVNPRRGLGTGERAGVQPQRSLPADGDVRSGVAGEVTHGDVGTEHAGRIRRSRRQGEAVAERGSAAPQHGHRAADRCSGGAVSFAADQQVGVPVAVQIAAGDAAAEVVFVPGRAGDAGGVLSDVDVLVGQAMGGAEGEENSTGAFLAVDRLTGHADGQIPVSVAVEVVGQPGRSGNGTVGRDGHQTAGQRSCYGNCHGETDRVTHETPCTTTDAGGVREPERWPAPPCPAGHPLDHAMRSEEETLRRHRWLYRDLHEHLTALCTGPTRARAVTGQRRGQRPPAALFLAGSGQAVDPAGEIQQECRSAGRLRCFLSWAPASGGVWWSRCSRVSRSRRRRCRGCCGRRHLDGEPGPGQFLVQGVVLCFWRV